MTNEEKTSFDGIVVSGGYPESLQKKAVKFSEEVSNGYHYKDLEVGFKQYASWITNNEKED